MLLEKNTLDESGPEADERSRPFDAVRPRGAGGLRIAETSGAKRSELEALIARRFYEVYGATLYTFLPHLFGLRDAAGRLIAAFGLRRADEGPLFLERYLSMPIEELVAKQSGAPVGRCAIAEVGNLAGATPGALREVIPEVTRLLHEAGIRRVAFTGSSRICNGFTRLGLPLGVAAPADIERLPDDERRRWGTYYAHSPSVMVGDVEAGARLVERLAARPGRLGARLALLGGLGAP